MWRFCNYFFFFFQSCNNNFRICFLKFFAVFWLLLITERPAAALVAILLDSFCFRPQTSNVCLILYMNSLQFPCRVVGLLKSLHCTVLREMLFFLRTLFCVLKNNLVI